MADDFWSFALRAYALPGVAAQCLRWQDDFGADVVLLLAGWWLAARRRSWSPPQVAALERHCAIWRQCAVLPLRAARAALQPAGLHPALKRAELDAERVQIGMIGRWLERGDLPAAGAARSCARANLGVYAARLPLAPSAAALAQLLDAGRACLRAP